MCSCLNPQRVKYAGNAIGISTILGESLLFLAYGYYYYVHWERFEKTPWAYPKFDIGTSIAVVITFLSLMTCNVCLMFGIAKSKIVYIVPWMVMHAALFIEAVVTCIIFLFSNTSSDGINVPSLISSMVVIYIFVAFFLVKILLVNIFSNNASNFLGSDSREQFLEMGSYAGTSPRLSCFAPNSLHPPIITTVRSASIC
ncbi:unnamed protein product [Lepeophtheirus salmonis]|uniref:(salmon louse) hypothetical protein n=1 Tax=Lepeophtheirus salmonis TaxID=72036 RepID=A0A0K2UI08_LEPSM|nr:unnamed protein product [Lepeophtheirus salmonis]CAF2798566.1 unnamed protein product [Lepeophtheirus salmonis]